MKKNIKILIIVLIVAVCAYLVWKTVKSGKSAESENEDQGSGGGYSASGGYYQGGSVFEDDTDAPTVLTPVSAVSLKPRLPTPSSFTAVPYRRDPSSVVNTNKIQR